MSERLTWEEITERYPEEWAVVIEIDDDPSEAEIRSACVFFHSADRDEAEATALKLPVPRHVGVFYTGKLIETGLVPML